MINKGDTLNGTSAAHYTYLEIKIQKGGHNERKHWEMNQVTYMKIKRLYWKYNSACDDVEFITSRLSTNEQATHTYGTPIVYATLITTFVCVKFVFIALLIKW